MKILIINNKNSDSLKHLVKSLEKNIKGEFAYSTLDVAGNLDEINFDNVSKNKELKNWLLDQMKGEKDDLYMIIDENKYCVDGFDVSSISEAMSNQDVFCFSLSLGKNVTHCANMNCDNVFKPSEEKDGLLFWDWTVHYFDFGYPLNLDGTVFRGKEMSKLLKSISFTNSLELENGLQIFDNYPKPMMASFENSKMVELIFENPKLWINFDYKKLKGDRSKYVITLQKTDQENEVADQISDEV